MREDESHALRSREFPQGLVVVLGHLRQDKGVVGEIRQIWRPRPPSQALAKALSMSPSIRYALSFGRKFVVILQGRSRSGSDQDFVFSG